MSDINNNIPTRITQLEEATEYEDGMFFAVAKAGRGTYKIPVDEMTPNEQALSDKMENEIVPAVENSFAYGTVDESEIASFPDGSELPLKVLEVAVEPQQEGSGDPSPTNIRPISGWSAVDVTKTGKNLFDLDAVTSFIKGGVVSTQGLTNQDGVITNSKSYGGDGIFSFDYPMTFNSNTITVSADIKLSGNHSSNNVFIDMFDSNGSNTSAVGEVTMSNKDTWEHKTVTLQLSLLTNVNLAIEARGTNNSVQIKNVQVEVGSQATTYEPYNPNSKTITIQLGDTYYGGKLRIVNGVAEFVADRAYLTLTETGYNWQSGSWGGGYRYFTSNRITDAKNNQTCQTSIYKANNILIEKGITIDTATNTNQIDVRTPDFSSLTDWKTFLASNPVDVVYKLATPTTIQLTPTQVNSLMGVNNIWANTGNINKVEYIRDLDIVINSLLERIAALEG